MEAAIIEKESLEIFERVGVVRSDVHYVYTAGDHSGHYVAKDDLVVDILSAMRLLRMLAFLCRHRQIDVVVGPEKGAVNLAYDFAYWYAEQFQGGRAVTSIPAAKRKGEAGADDSFIFERGYEKHVRGKRVFIIEDVLTTGGSVKKVVQLINDCGGDVMGVGVLWNRSGVTPQDVTPAGCPSVPVLMALVNRDFPKWPAGECPLCAAGTPVNTDLGHGAKFLAGLAS